ncbi:hypothetical protein K469DRAFT_730454 [Zopfia rhizophila CBS 207.26]|uniref:Rhodopsin domain-containing protein n=1 Tax=Zopfia rhizophila CBS 207.26 TaxID=1314779 RepID=A0A6A6DL25_9PEZI|nr:hypothetical protein K469DRAFT_730454 [Zopfia rhizophila CBS 207.26]
MDTTTAPILLGVGGGLLFLTLGLLAARLYSRLRPVVHLHWDDWIVLAATILAIVNYFLLSASVFYGLGRHARFVSFSRRKTASELLFISQVVWYWSITFVKLSVAFLLLRVKRGRRWKIFMYCIMAILIIAAIIQTFFQFLQCRPFSVYWDPSQFRKGPVKCFRRAVAIDLMFSFIPITFISKLNRPRREKVFMCTLMGLGLFASAAAIMRTLQLQAFYSSQDLFRTNVMIALWAIVEQQFGLIAAMIPTLKAFLEQTLLKISLFFYDKNTETEVRSKLVHFGLLEEERPRPVPVGPVSPKVDKNVRDEYGDTIVDTSNDKEVEDILTKMT